MPVKPGTDAALAFGLIRYGFDNGGIQEGYLRNANKKAAEKNETTFTDDTWLVREEGGGLALMSTANAGNPLTEGKTPLLTCDVWEHAYYIDYRNARPRYVEAFWNRVDWRFVESNLGG